MDGHLPPDRFLVLDSTDLYSDPGGTYREVLRFLALPAWSPREFSNHSYVGSPAPAAPPMDPAFRRQLSERFAEANQGLAELVGRDFPWNG